MDAGERQLFEQSVRAATTSATGPALDVALDELGWRDALDADARTAVSVVFELQGRAGVSSTALTDVLGSALPAATELLVLPRLGALDPPGARLGNGRIAVRGMALRPPRSGETATVVLPDGASGRAVQVPVDELTVRAVQGLDPRLGLVEVRSPAEGLRADLDMAAPVAWEDGLAAGRIAVGHQLVGVAAAMLDMAREHALGRVQFGRPIAAFQAVRHRLAESLVAVETARAALEAAWDDDSAVSAAMAKAVAGRSCRLVARHAQQVLAGMGFTAEHPFHGYLRRALVLDELLGSSRVLTRELGAEIIRTRRLPDLLPL